MASISDLTTDARRLPPLPGKHSETVFCSILPALDGQSWGRECRIKKLSLREQIQLLSLVQDAVQSDRQIRADDAAQSLQDMDVMQTDAASRQFWESVFLLQFGCVEPNCTRLEALSYISSDDLDGIPGSDVAQFLLHHIRALNDEAPGMEDLASGLAVLRRTPLVLAALEQAYLKGGDALDVLLDGKAAGTQEEMASFLERWGGIIAATAFSVVRKQAKIQGEESAAAMMEQFIKLAVGVGFLQLKEGAST